MTPGEKPSPIEEMQDRWKHFASEDPMYYIALAPKGTSPEEFFAQGEALARSTLDWLGSDQPRDRMLEIGCGLGRVLRHFAPEFQRVDGIDIAEDMIRGAERLGQPENVHLMVGSGTDVAQFADSTFDFVFSYEVFQHIPEPDVVEHYVAEVARVLAPGGRAVLQYDTRRMSMLARIYFGLPERLRRRPHRRYIRRYRRDPKWLREVFERHGLDLVDERGVRTATHFVLLARPG